MADFDDEDDDDFSPKPKWRKILRPILWILDYFADSRWYTTAEFEQKLIHWHIELSYYIYGVDPEDFGRRAITPTEFCQIYQSHPLLAELFKAEKEKKDG